MKDAAILHIVVKHQGWRKIPRLRKRLQETAAVTLAHLPKKRRFPCHATVLLTGDAAIRRLNRDFRGIDKATNVLSFPQYEPADLPRPTKVKAPLELGDIVIAYPYIVAEARAGHKILIDHLCHLLSHGILHLFGYDHMNDRQAQEMEGLEIKIMKAMNLPDPYRPAAKTAKPVGKPRSKKL